MLKFINETTARITHTAGTPQLEIQKTVESTVLAFFSGSGSDSNIHSSSPSSFICDHQRNPTKILKLLSDFLPACDIFSDPKVKCCKYHYNNKTKSPFVSQKIHTQIHYYCCYFQAQMKYAKPRVGSIFKKFRHETWLFCFFSGNARLSCRLGQFLVT